MKSKVIMYSDKCIINFDFVTRVYKENSFIVIDFVNGTNVKIPCDEWELENCFDLYLSIMSSRKVGNLVKKFNERFEKHRKEMKDKGEVKKEPEEHSIAIL